MLCRAPMQTGEAMDMDPSEWVFRGPEEDEHYSETRFYTRSTDSKGHKSDFRVAVPPGLAADIHALVARGIYPQYRTAGDLFRDAIMHRMTWLAHNYGLLDLAEGLKRQQTLQRLGDYQQRERETEQMIEEIEDSIRRLKPDMAEWDEVMGMARDLLELLPPEGRWAERFKRIPEFRNL